MTLIEEPTTFEANEATKKVLGITPKTRLELICDRYGLYESNGSIANEFFWETATDEEKEIIRQRCADLGLTVHNTDPWGTPKGKELKEIIDSAPTGETVTVKADVVDTTTDANSQGAIDPLDPAATEQTQTTDVVTDTNTDLSADTTTDANSQSKTPSDQNDGTTAKPVTTGTVKSNKSKPGKDKK